MRHRIKQKLNQLHCNDVLKRPTHSNLANSKPHHCSNGYTTNSKHYNHLLHSDKGTYFYTHSMLRIIPLVLPVSALLLGVGLMISPVGMSSSADNTNNKAYAAEMRNEANVNIDSNGNNDKVDVTDYASIGFSISNNGTLLTDDNYTVSTEVVPGIVSYIDTNINVTTKNINKFYVAVQAAEGSTSELTGTKYRETITGVGEQVSPDNFSDNSWGYALTSTNTTGTTSTTSTDMSNHNVTYSTLPTYDEELAPQYMSNTNLEDGEYNLTLSFAAKINANKPADHYTTDVLVSVVADAKMITLADITYMQDVTHDICQDTPMASTDGVHQYQLKDSRDQKTYWVARLADGNCWMTQNLAIDPVDMTLTSEDSDVSEDWSAVSDWSGATKSDKIAWRISDVGEGHGSYGGYYTWEMATAGTGGNTEVGDNAASSICPSGWKLPIGGESTADGSFDKLGKTYGVTGGVENFDADLAIMSTAPLYFLQSGVINNLGELVEPDTACYWSATVPADGRANHFSITVHNGGVVPTNNYGRYTGYSVRCVVR